MDDDPEPTFDQVIRESCDMSGKLLSFGEQKCGTDPGEEGALEMIQHQESGDIGPAVDPESPKKSVAVKDLIDQALQTESRTSIFRRKEWRDQEQQVDFSSSAKSSTTSLRKPSRWTNQRLMGQDSRRNSQQAGAQQPLLSQKPSRAQAVNETDMKDPTWVSQRTGKVMKCRSQQTSLIWERKTLSEIMHPSSDESIPNKDEEFEFSTTEKDITSSGETANERDSGQKSRHGSKQLEGRVSKHSSQQHLEKVEPLRSSVHFATVMDTDENMSCISQKTGQEIKSKSQQTSLLWERSMLSDILKVYSQESEPECSREEKEGTTEDGEEDTQMEQATVKDAQSQIHHLEVEESRHDIEQAEEQKPEHHRKKHKSKIDWAQQTDSADSIKKELSDSSQQTEVLESRKTSLVDQGQDLTCSPEQTDVEESQWSSQQLVGQDSRCSSPQPELRDSQRSSQESLKSETKTSEEDESKVPSDAESELSTLDQKASCLRVTEENTWVSQKTGRVVRNQSQQTDRSWLLYFASKSQKLKRCISQQTDESFLQQYQTFRLKQAVEEHQQNHAEPDMQKCSQCSGVYGQDLGMLSSFSTMSTFSTICSLESTGTESDEEQETSTSGDEEEQLETQQPLQQESQRGSQQVGKQESPKDMGQESRRSSLQAADDQTPLAWAKEFESNSVSETSSLYSEGEDKIQQTYSIISFEDGIWLNRKSGKLLVSHSQQTSEILEPKVSGAALEKSGSTKEEGLAPMEMDDTGVGIDQYFQPEVEVISQQTSGQESQQGGQQDEKDQSHLILVQSIEGLVTAEEVTKVVCKRLTEATLLSLESPDVEDGPVQIYTAVSSELGMWMNVKTGKLLASHAQQTEASSQQNCAEDQVPSQKSPEEGQVEIPQRSPSTT